MRVPTQFSALLVGCSVVLALAGCQNANDAKTDAPTDATSGTDATATTDANAVGTVTTAAAQLAGPDGTKYGTAMLTAIDGGLKLEVKAENLAAGEHGIHLHTTGKCEGPKFESAGSHWNPTSKQHGLENPQGSHSGDMPNIKASGSTTNYSYDLEGASLTEGTMAVLDADGTAIVIHAKPDDNKTDPAGNSGDRIICGIFAKS